MSAFPYKRSTIGVLDNLRLEGGVGKLIDYFRDLATNDLQKAIALLNEHELNYASLYLLKPILTETGISMRLYGRSRMAMELTDRILAKKQAGIAAMIRTNGVGVGVSDGVGNGDGVCKGGGVGFGLDAGDGIDTVITNTRVGSHRGTRRRAGADSGKSVASVDSGKSVASVHSTLKWMFETGSADDGLENRYDEVMELTAIQLVKSFKDNTVLERIAQTIFERNRKGLLTNHLIWAFFEAHNPRSLSLLADYLLTGNQSDAALASKLLGFIHGADRIGKTAYTSVIQWIDENSVYLQYTGESYHQTCNPIPYTICNEAKYLCKPVSTENGIAAEAFTPHETAFLDELKGLDPNTVALLASHSVMLNRRSSSRWRSWLHYPVIDRIRIARSAKGDFR